jgi:hypothetical protein
MRSFPRSMPQTVRCRSEPQALCSLAAFAWPASRRGLTLQGVHLYLTRSRLPPDRPSAFERRQADLEAAQDGAHHRQGVDGSRAAGAASCDRGHAPYDAMAFITTQGGRAIGSPAAFGNAFTDWCSAAGLRPVTCGDDKVRSYRIHGLRKASLTRLAHDGCTGPELMAVSRFTSQLFGG